MMRKIFENIGSPDQRILEAQGGEESYRLVWRNKVRLNSFRQRHDQLGLRDRLNKEDQVNHPSILYGETA